MGGGGGGEVGREGFDLLISEITGSMVDYPVSHKKMPCLFLSLPTYLLNIMVSTTQTLAQIKSQELIATSDRTL